MKIDYIIEVKDEKGNVKNFFFWDNTVFGFQNIIKWLTGIDLNESIELKSTWFNSNNKFMKQLRKYMLNKKAVREATEIVKRLDEIKQDPDLNQFILNPNRDKNDIVLDINVYYSIAQDWQELVKQCQKKGRHLTIKKE